MTFLDNFFFYLLFVSLVFWGLFIASLALLAILILSLCIIRLTYLNLFFLVIFVCIYFFSLSNVIITIVLTTALFFCLLWYLITTGSMAKKKTIRSRTTCIPFNAYDNYRNGNSNLSIFSFKRNICHNKKIKLMLILTLLSVAGLSLILKNNFLLYFIALKLFVLAINLQFIFSNVHLLESKELFVAVILLVIIAINTAISLSLQIKYNNLTKKTSNLSETHLKSLSRMYMFYFNRTKKIYSKHTMNNFCTAVGLTSRKVTFARLRIRLLFNYISGQQRCVNFNHAGFTKILFYIFICILLNCLSEIPNENAKDNLEKVLFTLTSEEKEDFYHYDLLCDFYNDWEKEMEPNIGDFDNIVRIYKKSPDTFPFKMRLKYPITKNTQKQININSNFMHVFETNKGYAFLDVIFENQKKETLIPWLNVSFFDNQNMLKQITYNIICVTTLLVHCENVNKETLKDNLGLCFLHLFAIEKKLTPKKNDWNTFYPEIKSIVFYTRMKLYKYLYSLGQKLLDSDFRDILDIAYKRLKNIITLNLETYNLPQKFSPNQEGSPNRKTFEELQEIFRYIEKKYELRENFFDIVFDSQELKTFLYNGILVDFKQRFFRYVKEKKLHFDQFMNNENIIKNTIKLKKDFNRGTTRDQFKFLDKRYPITMFLGYPLKSPPIYFDDYKQLFQAYKYNTYPFHKFDFVLKQSNHNREAINQDIKTPYKNISQYDSAEYNLLSVLKNLLWHMTAITTLCFSHKTNTQAKEENISILCSSMEHQLCVYYLLYKVKGYQKEHYALFHNDEFGKINTNLRIKLFNWWTKVDYTYEQIKETYNSANDKFNKNKTNFYCDKFVAACLKEYQKFLNEYKINEITREKQKQEYDVTITKTASENKT